MAVGKNKRLTKGGKKSSKKKVVDPFTKKDWYDVKAPSMFVVRQIGKTLVTRTQGTRIASDGLKGRVFEVSLADLQNDEVSFRKFKLMAEEVQGRNVLTNFHGMDLTRDKLCSMVKKWQTMIQAHVDVKTTDGYLLRMFCIGFTKKKQFQVKKTCYAQIRFYTPAGHFLRNQTVQLPPAYVASDWYKSDLVVKFEDIEKYTSFSQTKDSKYLPIDPHVLATPILADLNNDFRVEELVIPVSYFYEEDDYRVKEKLKTLGGLEFSDIDKYLVAGITVLNLTTGQTIWNKLLDLTQVDATFPAYNIFSPTVIDLDVDGGQLEVIMGTSAGSLFVFNQDGSVRTGWPVSQNTIHGQITAADLAGDGVVKIITIDTSANVICYNKEGSKLWESVISGTSSPGSRLYDVDKDGTMDIIITTDDGFIYALNGVNGTVLPDWPVSVGARMTANVLITRVSTTHTIPDMVVMADDGSIHLISMDLKCKSQIPLGETSLVQVLSHDLIKWFSGMELLIATSDGTLMCLATGQELAEFDDARDETLRSNHMLSLTSETKTANDFSFSEKKTGVYITTTNKIETEVTGETFPVEFEIIDPLYKPGKSKYFVAIYFGNRLLMQGEFPEPKTYNVQVPAGEEPSQGHVTVRLTNQYGQIFEDRFSLRFNKLIMEDLQWLLLAPFVAMIIILLVLHGFPAKDLLPYTNQSKSN